MIQNAGTRYRGEFADQPLSSLSGMRDASVLSVLRERAELTPDDLAFTFTDYDHVWEGVVDRLTWSQLYRRTLNLADELSRHGAPGDRALIVAPQGGFAALAKKVMSMQDSNVFLRS